MTCTPASLWMAALRIARPAVLASAALTLIAGAPVASAQGSRGDQASVRAELRDEAAEARALATRLWDVAKTFDREFHVGTMNNEAGVPQHLCYALGRLVGQSAATKHLRPSFAQPFRPASSGDAFDLRVRSQSLSNFESAVLALLDESPEEHAYAWNLDCIGRQRIRGVQIDTSGFVTRFKIVNEGRGLIVVGDIKPGYAQQLRAAILANPNVTAVALGSGGGLIAEAIEAGRFIRSRGLITQLSNYCYSACPLVFMGGRERQNWSPYPGLGFHRVYSSAGAAPNESPVYRVIAAYASEMGVDAAFVLRAMWAAPPESMNTIEGSRQELCNARVITWVQRDCSAP